MSHSPAQESVESERSLAERGIYVQGRIDREVRIVIYRSARGPNQIESVEVMSAWALPKRRQVELTGPAGDRATA